MSYGAEPYKPRCPDCGGVGHNCSGSLYGSTYKCFECHPYGRAFQTDRVGGSSREEKKRALEVAARRGKVHPGTSPDDEG